MLSKTFHRLTLTLAGLLLAGLSLTGIAQEMTPARYVAMDLEVRQATVTGAEERLALVEAGAGPDAQFAADAEVQERVGAIYRGYGTTGSQAAAWATRNRQAILDWLAEHPDRQADYDRLEGLLEATSARLQALAVSPDQ